MPTLRVLLVGLGSIGRRHLANLRRLSPSADITVWRHRQREDDEPGVDRFVYGLEDALAHRPEIAVLASPASYHVRTALQLARCGVHLFVEKPLSSDLHGVDELIDECGTRGVVLMIGYQFRFLRSLRVMREAILAGHIGTTLAFRGEAGQYLPDWRPDANYRMGVSASRSLGGGALLELSHEIDLAAWLVGDITSVFAQVRRLSDLEIDVEDFAELVMESASGAVGSVRLDFFRVPKRRYFEILGSQGTLIWDAAQDSVRGFMADTREWRTLYESTESDRNSPYLHEMKHFLHCARTGSTPCVSGDDGRRVLQVVAAARQSAEAGRRVNL